MKAFLLLWASIAVANPLRLDFNIHIDLPESSDKENVASVIHSSTAEDLPVVELPYEKHKASPSLTKDEKFYSFRNIPYAKQPIGDLRFKAAEKLDEVKNNKPTNDGQNTVVCPQSQVGWVPFANAFLQDYYLGAKLDKWNYPIAPKNNYTWSKKDENAVPNQSESCLTLDVMVPKRIYDNKTSNDGYDAPVLIWLFGGGYVFGSKDLFGSPAGLFNSSLQVEDEIYEEFIFVAINYRLGAFGWLAGDTFEKEGGFENAGLSDQLAAFRWVQDNIQKFGGNPQEVTVAGQSAGASSILHHLTSHGGGKFGRDKTAPPFNRAVLQSPALLPTVDRKKMEKVYQEFLKAAQVTDFAALVKQDSKVLIEANSKTSYESPYGQFNYGPVVDDTYVLAPPHLLLQHSFIWPVSTVVSHNSAEGMLFTPPWVRTKDNLKVYIRDAYPRFDNESLDELTDKHYVYGNNIDAKQAIAVTGEVLADFAVNSNVFGLRKSSPRTYQYVFNFLPGLHGQDANYTFYPRGDSNVNNEQAQRLQRYLTSFVKWKDPNYAKLEADKDFESYYEDEKAMTFGAGTTLPKYDKDYEMKADTLDKGRSDFWLNAPYWGADEEQSEFARLIGQDRLSVQNPQFEL